MPTIADGDLAAISAPVDFLGVNYYTRTLVRADADTGAAVSVVPDGAATTAMGWEVYPDGLETLLVRLATEYDPPPLYVTENGAAYADSRRHDGSVHDGERVEYLRGHIDAVGRAIARGVPVGGYFVWSLLDNFEWAEGYTQRFGLVYVDYPSLERVPKESYRWYRDFIAAQHAATPETTAAV
jgi:beta-glucosidase